MYRKPQQPPYQKDRAPPPHTNTRVLLNTCTHTHVPLLTPRLGGKRQKDPCDTPCGFPSVSLSHLYRLVCKQKDSGQARGDLARLREKRGRLGASASPHLCHPLMGSCGPTGWKLPEYSAVLQRGGPGRQTRRILFCACVSSSFWDPDLLLLPCHPQALCLSLIKALFSFPPHPILSTKSLPMSRSKGWSFWLQE